MLEKYKPAKLFTINTAYWVDIYVLDEVWGHDCSKFSSAMQFQDIYIYIYYNTWTIYYIYIVQAVCEMRADFLMNILTHLFFRDMVIPLAARSYG